MLLSVGFDPGTRTFTAIGSNSLLLAQVEQGGTTFLAYNATPDDPDNLQVTAVPITAGAITVNVDDVGQTNTLQLDQSWDFTAAVTFNGDSDPTSVDVLDTSLLTGEAWQLSTANNGSVSMSGGLNTLSFTSVESAVGSLTGTLGGVDSPTADSTWTLRSGTADSPHTYALNSSPAAVLDFQGFGTLQGGQAADRFDIDGDAATGITWVTANLSGGAGDDVFAFADGTMLFGSIDGVTGSDTLDFSASPFGSFVTLTAAATAEGYQGTEDMSLNGYGFSAIDTLIGAGISDQLTGLDEVATWTLDGTPTYQTAGATTPLSFSGYTVLQGGSDVDTFNISANTTADIAGGAGADVFSFSGSAVLAGSIHGYDFLGSNPGTDTGDTLSYASYGSDVAVTLIAPATTDGYAGNEATSITGGSGFDGIDIISASAAGSNSLTGEDVDSTWTLGGTRTYQENGGVANPLDISDFENLHGGSGVDTFNISGTVTANLDGGLGNDVFAFADGAALTGTLDGGAGTDDVLDYSAYTTAVSVNLATSTATGTDGFSNIEGMVGGVASSSTLTGDDTSNAWAITADNAGNINGGAFTFSQVGNLTGGTAADTFAFSNGAMVDGTVDGKGGTDTLDFSAYTTGVTATASATNGNTLSDGTRSFGFSAIENVTGGSGNDTFAFNDTGALAGTVDGQGGTDTLDYSGYTAPVAVSLATSTATATGGFSSIEGMVGSSTQQSTLAGAHKTSAWSITGPNAGNINVGAFTFSQVGNLTGGILGDTFAFGAAGSVTGMVNGGSGTDTLDLSAYSADVTANITATNAGTISAGAANFNFLGMENLTGGSGNDTFKLGGNSVSLTGSIDGQGGSNTLDYSAYTAGVRVDLTKKTALNVKGGAANGISGIQNVVGGSGNDILIGDAGANILIGGEGNNVLSGVGGDDMLTGGSGRDILIGGAGTDVLNGGAGEDLLISDQYTQETNITALTALMAEWGRTDATYATRISHLDGSLAGGRNGTYKLTTGGAGTLVLDGAIDTLYGDAGLDWYIAASGDTTQTDAVNMTLETIGGVSELAKKKTIV